MLDHAPLPDGQVVTLTEVFGGEIVSMRVLVSMGIRCPILYRAGKKWKIDMEGAAFSRTYVAAFPTAEAASAFCMDNLGVFPARAMDCDE
jgi:hypothetical protein